MSENPEVADDPADPIESLTEYAAVGRSWVVVDATDTPIAYILVDVVDGEAHIAQLTVRPEFQGNGIGRRLIERSKRWARERRIGAITLTTFEDVQRQHPAEQRADWRNRQPRTRSRCNRQLR